MVTSIGTDTFANIFPPGGIRGMAKLQKPVAAAQPTNESTTPPADPGMEKLRRIMLKALTILIGGLAFILIIAKVITNFL